jgi:hypothetical protein
MKLPTSWGPATVLVVAVIVIVVAAGAVVTVVNPDTLSFSDYLDTLSKAAIGAGVLGVGRGLLTGASSSAAAAPADPDSVFDGIQPDDYSAVPDDQGDAGEKGAVA